MDVENPELSLFQKTVEQISELSKIAVYKTNMPKSVVFLHTNSKQYKNKIDNSTYKSIKIIQ